MAKDKIIMVRVTSEQQAEFEAKAKADGFKSVAAWLRARGAEIPAGVMKNAVVVDSVAEARSIDPTFKQASIVAAPRVASKSFPENWDAMKTSDRQAWLRENR